MPDEVKHGVFLERLTWLEAKDVLDTETIVVLPLGAAAKEHGPHLLLSNDSIIADYMARRIAAVAEIVIAPALPYHFYPAFIDYPGSTCLRLETARDLVVDIVRSLARCGPRRFYVLNTGVSTVRALKPAAELLAVHGILLHFTRLSDLDELESELAEQEGGTHADELETSMMLYIAPETVDMSKAENDYDTRKLPGMTWKPERREERKWSPSGIYGNATLATVEKGRVLVEARVQALLGDLQTLAQAPLPTRNEASER